MLKKLYLILIFTTFIYAQSFNQRIVNIIGYEEYSVNKSLIDYLFMDKAKYYQNGSINYVAVMEKLKDNGLLKVGLNEPQNVTISFYINNDPLKSLNIISESLKSLGYYYYFTKSLIKDQEKNTVWTISLKTQSALDPLLLAKELEKNNCLFEDIRKEDEIKWVYKIDTSKSSLSKAKKIILNEKVVFRKPLKAYLLQIDRGSKIYIRSKIGNHWFPKIIFYDKHLTILDMVKKDVKTDFLTFDIPEETEYIKIDDLYTLTNIKRGLSVTIKE